MRIPDESPHCGLRTTDWFRLFCQSVLPVGRSYKHVVLQVDGNRRVFHVALAFHALDDFFACEGAFTLQYPRDDVAHDARLVAPFFERVEPAADEDKAPVLDELVVGGCGVGLASEKLLDAFGDFGKVHRRTVALERKVCEIARVLDTHMRRVLAAPFTQRVAADALRYEKPARKGLVRAALHASLLEMFRKKFQKFLFGRELVGLYGFVETRQCGFDLLGELLIDMPARAKVVVFAAVAEMMPDSEQEKQVIAFSFVLRECLENRFLGKHGSERGDLGFEIFPVLCDSGVGVGITHRGNAVIFYLADTLAGDAVLLPDGIQRATLPLSGKSETVRKHTARALR